MDDSDGSETRAEIVGTKDPVTYYKDIKPIVDQKCTQCHSGEGGQFALSSYADIKPLAAAVKASVVSGSMPPWSATGPAGQFLGDRRLTDAEASKLVGWIEQGSPEGNAGDARPVNRPAAQTLSKVDLSLAVQDAYTPAAGGDDYRCFILEWTPTTNKYITGVNIVPGDAQLVRHANVYVVPPADVATIAARDGLDGELGWSCMSGPANSPWLGSYEPAGGAKLVPGGAGVLVQPASAIVLQVHYNTLSKGGPDKSKVDFTLADTSSRPGQIALLFNPTWSAKGLRIPAGEADVPFRQVFRPTNLARGTTYDILTADLHMHKLGKSGSVGIVRQSGASEPILTIGNWEYGWQQTYTLATPVKLGPQDNLYVECHFDNTPENQPIGASPVERNWGETPNDEICIGNVLAAGPAGSVPPDAGTRDAGVPDAGRDAGTQPPVRDAGRPPVPDAGPRDAGTQPPVRDAGTQPPVRDAGNGRPPTTDPRADPSCQGSTTVNGPGVISVGRTDLSGSGGSVTRCIR